jgi:hypothetical protein
MRLQQSDVPAEPLCWAVAGLVGPARRIRVVGSLADRFAALAAVDPRRTLILEHKPQSDHRSSDLVVAIDSVLSSGELIALALAQRSDAPRMILATTRPANLIAAAGDDADVFDACHWLIQRGRLSLYRLPDPAVPWLTPCDEPRYTHQLIAEWTARPAHVLRKAA